MPAVPLLYRWIILAVLIAASAAFGAMKMHAHDRDKYAAFVAQVKAEGQAQVEHTAQVIAKQKGITNDAATEYARRLANLRRYYAKRVQPNPGPCPLPAVSIPAPGADETTANPVPPASPILGNQPDSGLAAQCAETTLMLVSLQQWIASQQRIEHDPIAAP